MYCVRSSCRWTVILGFASMSFDSGLRDRMWIEVIVGFVRVSSTRAPPTNPVAPAMMTFMADEAKVEMLACGKYFR